MMRYDEDIKSRVMILLPKNVHELIHYPIIKYFNLYKAILSSVQEKVEVLHTKLWTYEAYKKINFH